MFGYLRSAFIQAGSKFPHKLSVFKLLKIVFIQPETEMPALQRGQPEDYTRAKVPVNTFRQKTSKTLTILESLHSHPSKPSLTHLAYIGTAGLHRNIPVSNALAVYADSALFDQPKGF